MMLRMSVLLSALLFAVPALAINHPRAGEPSSDVEGRGDILIENEQQFVSDYGQSLEKMADGVYLFTKGAHAGQVVAMGEAGLEYDIAMQQRELEQAKAKGANPADAGDLLGHLLEVRASFERAEASGEAKYMAQYSGLACSAWYYDSSSRTWRYALWGGYLTATAASELYLDRGDGSFNTYYARASAKATAVSDFPPYGVPYYGQEVWTATFAKNRATGETKTMNGINYAATGYVYSGPAFSHDLLATAYAGGTGHCSGYVSVKDEMVGVKF